MRRRITLSTALVASLLLVLLTSSDSTTRAQQQRRTFVWDTGVVTLGPSQVLRLMAAEGDGKLLGDVLFSFRRMGYVEADNVYKLAAQEVTDPVRLRPGEAVSIEVSAFTNGGTYPRIRGVVESNRQDVRVTAQIINKATGQVDSIMALLLP